jgi:arylsulfatase A-like enzyme
LRSRRKDKPFFFWLAALDPHREYTEGSLHPPHRASDVVVPPYLPDTPEVRHDLRMYYDEIGRLDRYVGQVMEELSRQDVARNTCVMFISDNGRPFPRDKTTLYDGGIRTPWIVRWPGKVEPGSVSRSLVSAIDLAPTILEIANARRDKSLPGVSFLATLTDPARRVRDYAFAEDHWHDFEDHGRCIVGKRFKLIRNDYADLPSTPPADALRSPTWRTMQTLHSRDKLSTSQRRCWQEPRPTYELYDLDADPYELENLAEDRRYRAARERLVKRLEAWAEATDDYLPTVRTPDEFNRVTGEPDHCVRVRPRRSKQQMFGTSGAY